MKVFKIKDLKLKIVLLSLMLWLGSYQGVAQELSKKELKEKKKVEKEKVTVALIESRTFVFKGSSAVAQKGRTIDLTTRQNFVKFSPDSLECDMPFFGTATGISYGGGDGGYSFIAKPAKFDLKKNKKNYKINIEVKDSKDNYVIFLNIGLEGGATLSISSNNRSTMTYFGNILKE